jgi:hypothetical protein
MKRLMLALLVIALTAVCAFGESEEFNPDEFRDANDNTLLILAAVNGNKKTVKDLLRAGADVNIRNKWGMSALMYAAEGDHAGIVKVLLGSGADINARNNEGSTALMISAIHGCKYAAYALLEAGADVKIKNNNGKRAVDYARENESLKDTRILKRLEELSGDNENNNDENVNTDNDDDDEAVG